MSRIETVEVGGTEYTLGADKDSTITFTEAQTRTNIASGESLATMFGKIKKFFTDLKTVAFTGNIADMSDVTITSPTSGDTLFHNGTGWENKNLMVEVTKKVDLASINVIGSTNTTGSAISAGTYFYLNGLLVRAKANIATNATFTLDTNYEIVTAGALNELGYDTGAQDIKYESTVVGYYQRVGHVVTVFVRYTGTLVSSGTFMSTYLPADCRPPRDIQLIVLTSNAGNQNSYGWIYHANGGIQLVGSNTPAGIFTITYVV